MTFIDYIDHYYLERADTAAPSVVRGKFVLLTTGSELYLVMSPVEFTKYHADIVEKFCIERGIGGRYDREKKRFAIADPAWSVTGGGKFELDKDRKTIRFYDDSMAYGKYDKIVLRQSISGIPEFTGYTIVTE